MRKQCRGIRLLVACVCFTGCHQIKFMATTVVDRGGHVTRTARFEATRSSFFESAPEPARLPPYLLRKDATPGWVPDSSLWVRERGLLTWFAGSDSLERWGQLEGDPENYEVRPIGRYFEDTRRFKRGTPIPPDYVLPGDLEGSRATNRVSLAVDESFFARVYSYEERFEDAVPPEVPIAELRYLYDNAVSTFATHLGRRLPGQVTTEEARAAMKWVLDPLVARAEIAIRGGFPRSVGEELALIRRQFEWHRFEWILQSLDPEAGDVPAWPVNAGATARLQEVLAQEQEPETEWQHELQQWVMAFEIPDTVLLAVANDFPLVDQLEDRLAIGTAREDEVLAEAVAEALLIASIEAVHDWYAGMEDEGYLERVFGVHEFGHSYQLQIGLSLPGTVQSHNGHLEQDGTLTWQIEPDTFLWAPYTMSATSRVVLLDRAVLVTVGLAVVLLATAVVLGRRRRYMGS